MTTVWGFVVINISRMTGDVATIAEALNGKWERKNKNGTTWVINGQIAVVYGDLKDFPYNDDVMWCYSEGSGHIGIFK